TSQLSVSGSPKHDHCITNNTSNVVTTSYSTSSPTALVSSVIIIVSVTFDILSFSSFSVVKF
ncbi:unnamed protein product, partial [Candidula unifasciata]